MVLSDLISIPQHRDREYPEAWLLMGASISHRGKACLITHSNTTVPRVVDFPNGHWFTDQRRTVRHMTLFFNAQATDAVMLQVCKMFLSYDSYKQSISELKSHIKKKYGVGNFLALYFMAYLELLG